MGSFSHGNPIRIDPLLRIWRMGPGASDFSGWGGADGGESAAEFRRIELHCARGVQRSADGAGIRCDARVPTSRQARTMSGLLS